MNRDYLDYLRSAYGLERAEAMLKRPDISQKEIKKLRKLYKTDEDDGTADNSEGAV